MLIGLRHRFIFIATLKTASTSIEAVLAPYAELRFTESMFGKHMTVQDLERNLGWMFEERRLAEFFIFGVMRDPIDFMLSLYNSHRSKRFADLPHVYAGGMSFSDFLTDWVPRNAPQVTPQHVRFLDSQGRIGANYILTMDRLHQGMTHVCRQLGLRRVYRIKRLNASEAGFSRSDLSHQQICAIQKHFEGDYSFIERYCNVPIRSFSVAPGLALGAGGASDSGYAALTGELPSRAAQTEAA